MNVFRALRWKLWLGVASLVLVAAASQRAQAQSAPQAASAVDVATRWLYALKRGDTRVLDSASVYPFELRIAKAPCNCEGGKARDSAELAQVLGDLMKTEDVQALEVTSGKVKEIAKGSVPGWAKRWTKKLPKGARLVHAESAGGATYTIRYLLVITDDQVRSVWLDAAAAGR
jgi:hypothetical protein